MVVYTLVYASLSGPEIELQKMPILSKEKLSFQMTNKIVAFEAQKTRTHNWIIFFRKWTRKGRYSQWWSLLSHVEGFFVHNNWRGRYCQHLVSTGLRYVIHSRTTLNVLRPGFEDCIISLRANVVWPFRSCDLTPLNYYLWGAVKYKC